ncbi:MAG: hypothetical protein ACYDCQ_13870 [Dehalococcoidia bacterium]
MSTHIPYIPVIVLLNGSALTIETEALVDTGFDGSELGDSTIIGLVVLRAFTLTLNHGRTIAIEP